MDNQIVIYNYQDNEIEFSLADRNVMVNATEMAKVFGRTVQAFLRNDDTEKFISACLKSENSRFINTVNRDDLYYSRQKSGTWMHRILALKFASWLNPDFELWVYYTFDQIVFSHAKKLEETNQERAKLRAKIEVLKTELTIESEKYAELERLELAERQLAYKMNKVNRNQLTLFIERAKESAP